MGKRNLKTNQSGVLYVYIVIIITLFAAVFFSFLLASGIEQVQIQLNPSLGEEKWHSTQHYETFSLAAWFTNNIWLAFPALIIFGLMYWGYNEAQRRQN